MWLFSLYFHTDLHSMAGSVGAILSCHQGASSSRVFWLWLRLTRENKLFRFIGGSLQTAAGKLLPCLSTLATQLLLLNRNNQRVKSWKKQHKHDRAKARPLHLNRRLLSPHLISINSPGSISLCLITSAQTVLTSRHLHLKVCVYSLRSEQLVKGRDEYRREDESGGKEMIDQIWLLACSFGFYEYGLTLEPW